MAIRAGGGGLKYALPSQAEIQARQAAAAASAGGSAAASAYGANRRYAGLKKQLQYDAVQSGLDRQFRAQQAYLDRGFQAERDYLGRQHDIRLQESSQQAAAERQSEQFKQQKALQTGAQEFDAQQAKLQRQFYSDRDAARFEQEQAAFEMERDVGIEEGIRTGDLELPGKAAQRLRELEDDRARVQGKDWTDEQRAEYEQQYQDEKRRLLRQAGPRRTPTATEQAQGVTTYFNPATGSFSDQMSPGMIPGQVRDGQFQPLMEQQDPTEGLQEEIQQIMQEETAEGTLPFGDFDDAYGEALRRREVIAGQGQQQPQTLSEQELNAADAQFFERMQQQPIGQPGSAPVAGSNTGMEHADPNVGRQQQQQPQQQQIPFPKGEELQREVREGRLPPFLIGGDRPGLNVQGAGERHERLTNQVQRLDSDPTIQQAIERNPVASQLVEQLKELYAKEMKHLEQTGMPLHDKDKTKMLQLMRDITAMSESEPRQVRYMITP